MRCCRSGSACAASRSTTRSTAGPSTGTWSRPPGARLAATVGTRLGLPTGDRSVLVDLVRNHLLLADTATRRDLDDPATVRAVASAVGGTGTLALLHALTEADARATGPTAWTPWKARLVEELVGRVTERIEGRPPAAAAREAPAVAVSAATAELVDREGLALRVEGEEVTVVARERRGLLWRVAGVLALHRLDVRAATVSVADGMAVIRLSADPRHGRDPDWRLVTDDLRRAFQDRLPLEQRLAEREAAYRQPAPLRPPPRVVFDAFYVLGPDGRRLDGPPQRAALVTDVIGTLR